MDWLEIDAITSLIVDKFQILLARSDALPTFLLVALKYEKKSSDQTSNMWCTHCHSHIISTKEAYYFVSNGVLALWISKVPFEILFSMI
jgi:hypothetical protein